MLRDIPAFIWVSVAVLAVGAVVAALIAVGIAWLLAYSD